MTPRSWIAAPVAAAILGLAAGARADGSEAEALFDRGRVQMHAGDFEAGCPTLAESYRLARRVRTLFTLAVCEARRGRFATASARFGEVLALLPTLSAEERAADPDLDRTTAEARASLAPWVPELTLRLARSAPEGTVVTCDGAVVAEAALGEGRPVDPGGHVITVQAPGHPPIVRHVFLAPGQKEAIVVGEELPPDPTPEGPPTPRRTAVYVMAGLGLGAVVAGGILGGAALAKKLSLGGACQALTLCSAAQNDTLNTGKAFGNGSTGALVAGGALLTASFVLRYTEPKRRAVPPPRPAGTGLTMGLLEVGAGGVVAGVRGGF